ncbi:MAG: starvation-inducible DNA-binding protein [Alphaproteobacteria bacterium]|jgi:starvation-inducible DNA-binding protein
MATNVAKISSEKIHEIAKGLHYALSDTFMLYLKTHTYHWNVEGPHFFILHQLFETQYTDMWQAVDMLAERIRSIGEMAPNSQNLIEMSTIHANIKTLNSNNMLKDLAYGHAIVIQTLKSALGFANEAEDEATAGILTDRIIAHEKHLWMLNSSVQ